MSSALVRREESDSIVLKVVCKAPKIDETIKAKGVETGHCQMFIAINCAAVADPQTADQLLKEAELAYLASEPDGSGTPIHIPGRLISKKHAQAEAEGVPVLEDTWKKILDLAEAEC